MSDTEKEVKEVKEVKEIPLPKENRSLGSKASCVIPMIKDESKLKFDNQQTEHFYNLPLNENQRQELYKMILEVYKKEGPEAFKSKDTEK
jgi:hypothetical protein